MTYADKLRKLFQTRKRARKIARVADAARATGGLVGMDRGASDAIVGAVSTLFDPEAGAHFLAGVMHARAAQQAMDPARYFRKRSAEWFRERGPDRNES